MVDNTISPLRIPETPCDNKKHSRTMVEGRVYVVGIFYEEPLAHLFSEQVKYGAGAGGGGEQCVLFLSSM